jgi:hypothetical protein
MRRRAVLERAETSQQSQLFLAEAGDVGEGIGSGKDGQQGQKQHLVERIHHPSGLPAIGQVTKMIQVPHGLEKVRRRPVPSRPWPSSLTRIEDRHRSSG